MTDLTKAELEDLLDEAAGALEVGDVDRACALLGVVDEDDEDDDGDEDDDNVDGDEDDDVEDGD